MKPLIKPLLNKVIKKKKVTGELVRKDIEEINNNYIEIQDSDFYDDEEEEGYLYTGTL